MTEEAVMAAAMEVVVRVAVVMVVARGVAAMAAATGAAVTEGVKAVEEMAAATVAVG